MSNLFPYQYIIFGVENVILHQNNKSTEAGSLWFTKHSLFWLSRYKKELRLC